MRNKNCRFDYLLKMFESESCTCATVFVTSRWQVRRPRPRGMFCNLLCSLSTGELPGRLDYHQGDRVFYWPACLPSCRLVQVESRVLLLFLENRDFSLIRGYNWAGGGGTCERGPRQNQIHIIIFLIMLQNNTSEGRGAAALLV